MCCCLLTLLTALYVSVSMGGNVSTRGSGVDAAASDNKVDKN